MHWDKLFLIVNIYQLVSSTLIFQGTREAKSAGLCSKIPADKYQNCHPQAEDSRSFHDYSSEDIERLTNVSFSSEQYTGRVLLVVNLASF